MFFCNFCYIPLQTKLKCGKCKNATYCSPICQAADWGETGQCHKKWCGVPYGIEGKDWEVKQSPGRGVGVFAKRDFKRDERIMVERMFLVDEIRNINFHLKSEFMRLEPPFNGNVEDTFMQKISRNAFGSVDGRGSVFGICFRMSRVNHACDPNASWYLDYETNATTLHAGKNIKAGEEITVSYTGFLDPTNVEEPSQFAVHVAKLQLMGVTCPENCACKDPKHRSRLNRSKALEAELESIDASKDLQRFLKVGMRRVRLHSDSALETRLRVRVAFFELAARYGHRLEGLGMHRIVCQLTRPGSAEAVQYEGV